MKKNEENESNVNNKYAHDIKENVVYIGEVDSGRKDYYCIGCGDALEARKGKKRAHYFAHVPRNLKEGERKCTYSDETYRHELAKKILQRIKQIKVPTLYKYPPNGVEGNPRKIKDAEIIKAATVRIERQFYENGKGEIQYGQNINFEENKEKFLLIQPDVAFFDEEDNPILLIEVVATHKIDAVKLSKLRRLGIDTVQVLLPKTSPEDIENCFYNTSKTHWVYNYEQETKNYSDLPKGNGEGILAIDEFQRKLLKAAESFECRRSQINNLIRGIKKCLESEQYRGVKGEIRAEISRVERNTEREQNKLDGLREFYKARIKEEFRAKEEELQKAETELDQRYIREKRNLEEQQKKCETEYSSEIKRIEGSIEKQFSKSSDFRKQLEEYKEEEERLDRAREAAKEVIRRIPEQEDFFEEQLRKQCEKKIDRVTRTEQKNTKRLRNEEENFSKENEQSERNFREGIARRRKALRDRFRRYREQADTAIKNGDFGADPRIFRRIQELHNQWTETCDYIEARKHIRRIQKAQDYLRKGTYKNWT